VADKQHLDPGVLSALREVMEDGFSTLVETFLADSEERLKVMQQADKAEQLIDAAHSFKGSCSNMGADRLAELCGLLEQSASAFPSAGIDELIVKIRDEFDTVRPLYEAEQQRTPAEN